jgi:hypothetical protein
VARSSGLFVQLRKRSRALLWSQGFSVVGFVHVALYRGEAHVEGAGRLTLRHAAFYGGDYLLSEVFGVTVHATMLASVHPRCNILSDARSAPLLSEGGRFPSKRTFQRRLKALPEKLPEQIGALGRHLVEVLKPWESRGRAVALDSTTLQAKGGVWHKKDKEADKVPHSSIDTEAGWTKSGWHGWVYGWKLHLAITVSSVWIPLSARLTPADVADNQIAPVLIEELPDEARFVLGDTHFTTPKTYARSASKRSDFWSPPNVGPTRTPTVGWR